MAKLTNKQAAFVREYLIDLNATQAAIRAGYSKKTAGVIGDENLKKPDIANAIRKATQKRAEKTEITAERVLTEIGKIAFAGDEVRESDRLRGLELLGKHLVLFSDKLVHDGEMTINEVKRVLVRD